MPSRYELISDDFVEDYQTSPDKFHELVRSAFDKASELNPKSGIDLLFDHILAKLECTLDQVKYMIELGADPRYDNDKPLLTVTGYSAKDVPEYLIDNFGARLCSEYICEIFMTRDKPFLDRLILYLDKGFKIEDNELKYMIQNVEIWEVLMDKGYDICTLLKHISEIKKIKRIINMDRIDIEKMYSFIISHISKPDFVLDQDVLNKLFYQLRYCKKITLDGVKIFINAGLDPRYDNDRFFVKLCRYDTSIVRYFINEHGTDVNAHNGKALEYALCVNNCETIKLLMDSGALVSEKHLQIALEKQENIEFFYQYSITEESVATQLIKTCIRKKSFINIAKQLVNTGIDFNEIIRNKL